MIRVVDISKKIEELVRAEGLSLASELASKVQVASGELRDSVKPVVRVEGPLVVLQLHAAKTLLWNEYGRKPGKFPPLAAIKRWGEIKGIPVKAAFPIALKIKEKGIDARPVLAPLIERHSERFRTLIKGIAGEQVQVIGRNLLEELKLKRA